jgi:GntR family transcriptional repressor for pyruvate dehydrogenase complex
MSTARRAAVAGRTSMDDRESTDLPISAVRRVRAYEEVVSQLQDLMQRRALKPGDRLPTERELADRFRVSRATIRQALSVLQAMGLVESRVGDGTFARADTQALTVTALASVLHAAPAGLAEQLELRRLLEPQVARLAAERVEEADLAEMRRCIAAQERRHRAGAPFVEEDAAFHLAIARATKNSLVVRMVESIHQLLSESRQRSLQTGEGRMRSLRWHRRIESAMRARRAQAASQAMLGHLLDVEALIRTSGPG